MKINSEDFYKSTFFRGSHMNLIDIHCHILPAVDDGPQNIDQALALAKVLLAAGISHVVATPHYMDDYSPAYLTHIKEQHSWLLQSLQREGLPLSVSLGGEVLLTPKVIELAKANKLPTL